MNHGILYHVSNSNDSIVFYKIDNKYFTLKLAKIDLGINNNRNIVAIYLEK